MRQLSKTIPQAVKTWLALALVAPLFLLTACADQTAPIAMTEKKDLNMENLQTITFGAGCFWCYEVIMERQDGVAKVESGYMGGTVENPTYEQITTGRTGHAEVVQVQYDPDVVSFEELMSVFWEMHDPTTLNRQGADVGTQYRSAVFYSTDEQKAAAEKSKALAQKHFDDPIVTEITPASTFYVAEDYHQDYYNQNPNAGYCRFVIAPKLKKLGLE